MGFPYFLPELMLCQKKMITRNRQWNMGHGGIEVRLDTGSVGMDNLVAALSFVQEEKRVKPN